MPSPHELLLRWQKWLLAVKGVSPHTAQNYAHDVAGFFKFLQIHKGGEWDLPQIGLTDFRAFLSSRHMKQISARSNARLISALKNFFKYLHEHESITNTDIQSLTSPKLPKTLPRPLSEDQALRLIASHESKDYQSEKLDWIALRDRALFALLYGSGLRISEALSLRIADLQADTIIVHGKGRKQRIVPLLPEVKKMWQEYTASCPFALLPDSFAFIGMRGEVLNPGVAQRAMRHLRGVMQVGDKATPHSLRHSYATHLLRNGANLRQIQALLGHQSLATTQKYTAVDVHQLIATYDKVHPKQRNK